MEATEILEYAMEFKENFLEDYPDVKDGRKTLLEFAENLEEYREQGNESEELDNLIALVSDPDLMAFAGADFDLGTLQDNMRSEEEQKGDHNGDEETMGEIGDETAGEAAGIEERADEVVDNIREALDEFILTLQ